MIIKCFYCKSIDIYHLKSGSRQVRTLQEDVTLDYDDYRCNKCLRTNRDFDTSVAPKGSKYSWEVLETIIALSEKGLKYREVIKEMKKYNIKLASSQISEIRQRHQGRIDIRNEIDNFKNNQRKGAGRLNDQC